MRTTPWTRTFDSIISNEPHGAGHLRELVRLANVRPSAAAVGAVCMVGLAPVPPEVTKTEIFAMEIGRQRLSRREDGCGLL